MLRPAYQNDEFRGREQHDGKLGNKVNEESGNSKLTCNDWYLRYHAAGRFGSIFTAGIAYLLSAQMWIWPVLKKNGVICQLDKNLG